jgi:hypothetical protein
MSGWVAAPRPRPHREVAERNRELSARGPIGSSTQNAGWVELSHVRTNGANARERRRGAGWRAAPAIAEPGHSESGVGPAVNGSQPRPPRSPDLSLLDGLSIKRVWHLALALSSLIAATDAVLGPRVILIGLLVAGPCCAVLTGRWALTAAASAWAIALAILLGFPDDIWGTTTHLTFLAAVTIVAIASTSSAAVLERRR